MWPFTLSGRLLIVGLVGRYPANCLIRRGSIPYHRSFSHCTMRYRALMRYYQSFPTAIPLYGPGYPRVTHPSATKFLPKEKLRFSLSWLRQYSQASVFESKLSNPLLCSCSLRFSKNLLLKKFSRVVVVYCSVIKVLCLCRSFQATAFIFYQKLLSLSRTFLFFFCCL